MKIHDYIQSISTCMSRLQKVDFDKLYKKNILTSRKSLKVKKQELYSIKKRIWSMMNIDVDWSITFRRLKEPLEWFKIN